MNTQQTLCKCKNPNCGKDFNVIPQEKQMYESKGLPLPDLCPQCRHRQRMALRNERQMYKRTCAKCQKSMLATYPEDAPYIIYCQTCFWENIG